MRRGGLWIVRFKLSLKQVLLEKNRYFKELSCPAYGYWLTMTGALLNLK